MVNVLSGEKRNICESVHLVTRLCAGRVVPDSFTHGTSEQRMRWFKKGFDTGDLRQGDTFNANPL